MDALKKAWEDANFDSLSKRLAGWLFKNYAKPEILKWAVDNNVDPVHQVFNGLHVGQSSVAPMARVVFKMAWNEIDKNIDFPFIYSELMRVPENQPILTSPKGNDYLKRCVDAARKYLYIFTWEICPQCQNPLKWLPEYNLWSCETCNRFWGLSNY